MRKWEKEGLEFRITTYDVADEAQRVSMSLVKNLMLEMVAFVDEVVYREGVNQPLAHSATSEVVCFFYVVCPSETAVAVDDDLKQVLNGVPPVMESAFGYGTLMQIVERGVLCPLAVDVRTGDVSGCIDGFHEPYIAAE